MKSNLLVLKIVSFASVGIITALSGMSSAAASETATTEHFDACKGIKMIPVSQASGEHLPENCQTKPDTGLMKVALAANEVVAPTAFLTKVAQQFKSNLQGSQKSLERDYACLSQPAALAGDCAAVEQAYLKLISDYAPQARRELALSRSEPGRGRVFSNAYLQSPVSGLPGEAIAGARDLSGAELESVRAQFQKEWSESQEKTNARLAGFGEISIVTRKAIADGFMTETQDRHQAAYRELIYEKAPFLSMLPAPKSWNAADAGRPVPQWDRATLADAVKKLIENAKHEIAATDRTLKNGTLEMSRITGERLYQHSLRGERDLLDFVNFKPVVEQVLADPKNKAEFCGVATGLKEHYDNKVTQNKMLEAGANVAGLVGTGIGARVGAAAAGKAAMLAFGASALATGGVGLGTAVFSVTEANHNLNSTTRLLQSRSGTDPKLGQVTDANALKEASSEYRSAVTGLAVTTVGAAGAVGVVAGNGIMKSAVSALKASKKMGMVEKDSAHTLDELRLATEAAHAQPPGSRVFTPLDARNVIPDEYARILERGSLTDLVSAGRSPEMKAEIMRSNIVHSITQRFDADRTTANALVDVISNRVVANEGGWKAATEKDIDRVIQLFKNNPEVLKKEIESRLRSLELRVGSNHAAALPIFVDKMNDPELAKLAKQAFEKLNGGKAQSSLASAMPTASLKAYARISNDPAFVVAAAEREAKILEVRAARETTGSKGIFGPSGPAFPGDPGMNASSALRAGVPLMNLVKSSPEVFRDERATQAFAKTLAKSGDAKFASHFLSQEVAKAEGLSSTEYNRAVGRILGNENFSVHAMTELQRLGAKSEEYAQIRGLLKTALESGQLSKEETTKLQVWKSLYPELNFLSESEPAKILATAAPALKAAIAEKDSQLSHLVADHLVRQDAPKTVQQAFDLINSTSVASKKGSEKLELVKRIEQIGSMQSKREAFEIVASQLPSYHLPEDAKPLSEALAYLARMQEDTASQGDRVINTFRARRFTIQNPSFDPKSAESATNPKLITDRLANLLPRIETDLKNDSIAWDGRMFRNHPSISIKDLDQMAKKLPADSGFRAVLEKEVSRAADSATDANVARRVLNEVLSRKDLISDEQVVKWVKKVGLYVGTPVVAAVGAKTLPAWYAGSKSSAGSKSADGQSQSELAAKRSMEDSIMNEIKAAKGDDVKVEAALQKLRALYLTKN